jgi:hypothetical protein
LPGIINLWQAVGGLVNTNITINATGTLGGAGAGQASMDSLPGTVGVGSAEAGLVNTNITINANATLTGAGGGTPSLASIGGLIINTQINVSSISSINVNMGDFTSGTIVVTGTLEGDHALVGSQTFTPTWTGFGGVPPTGTLSYLDMKNFAVLFATATRTGISNANAMTITNLPAAIRTVHTANSWGQIRNGSFDVSGGWIIDSTAIMVAFRGVDSTTGLRSLTTNFTTSGVKGVSSGSSHFYPIGA